jgi:hypothetical protein
MPHVHAVRAARPLNRAVLDRKDGAVPTPERYDFGTRLHPWPLLGQHEFAAREVLLRFREQNRHLQRKDVFPVQVLVQRVEVALTVLQQKRRRPRLPAL